MQMKIQYDRTVRPRVLNTALNTNKVQCNSNTNPQQVEVMGLGLKHIRVVNGDRSFMERGAINQPRYAGSCSR